MSEAKTEMGYASDPNWGLIMSGGHVDGFVTDTVELTHDGKTFEKLEPFPIPVFGHCLVIIDEDRLF
jgi:hypothetical protein